MSQPNSAGNETSLGEAMLRLVHILQQLRDPEGGCPWDRVQHWKSIVPHTIEEAYEVADAVERMDIDQIRDELGDLLFQVVYFAQFASEEGRFTLEDVARSLAEKLTRRHPHVFGEVGARDLAEVKSHWERTKAEERESRRRAGEAPSELDDVPVTLPALARAQKLQRRAARVGFDFATVADAMDKLQSEVGELAEALADPSPGRAASVMHELGDVIFAAVNVARREGVDPDAAVRAVNRRFETRFRFVERALLAEGRTIAETGEAKLDALWEAAKVAEKQGRGDAAPLE